MIYLALIAWMGWKLYAPTWFWVCWWLLLIGKVIEFAWKALDHHYRKK